MTTTILVEDRELCPDCGSGHVVQDYVRGELMCDDCGLVLNSNFFDRGPEWSAYTHEERESRSRVGPPVGVGSPVLNLTTDIPLPRKDWRGKSLDAHSRDKFRRMRALHLQSKTSARGERSLVQAHRVLERMASQMSLPQHVRNEVALIYKKAMKSGLVRGRSIETVMAAAIYVGCKMTGLPRTLYETYTTLGQERRKVRKAATAISRSLMLKVPLPEPSDFLGRFCSELGVDHDITRLASSILADLSNVREMNSKSAAGTAGASIYVASIMAGHRIAQRRISKVVGISEVTLRSRCKEIKRLLNLDLEWARGRSPSPKKRFAPS
jgi:transcription initiation factor TFIIB